MSLLLIRDIKPYSTYAEGYCFMCRRCFQAFNLKKFYKQQLQLNQAVTRSIEHMANKQHVKRFVSGSFIFDNSKGIK